jgi:hypothetical protein
VEGEEGVRGQEVWREREGKSKGGAGRKKKYEEKRGEDMQDLKERYR